MEPYCIVLHRLPRRKLALLHHPDKHIPGNDTDKEVRHKMFVLLANAYQVVSDEVIRNRYNFLLSKGKLVYEENHNWEEFDAKQARAQGDGAKTEFYSRVNADGKKVFVFRDAFQQVISFTPDFERYLHDQGVTRDEVNANSLSTFLGLLV